ncbi:MAG: tRNA (adenosine(37)-N6)-threonylcarbamoyltransferase complex ATPase subunit type 1 TsaE [bacterium]|nr:tRNA (adenosine(37)-N6)-threonylcarbamoyltransferase complex ATPase subunit type 1 TsaE [bacterium]
MNTLQVVTNSAIQTHKLGKKVGELLEEGDIISLVGELGVGKTCFTQGIAKGLKIKDYVNSPTFIIIKCYEGRLPLYHFDLYRIHSLRELYEIGYEEYLYGKGVTVIEWGEKIKGLLPDTYLRVEIDWLAYTTRCFSFAPFSEHFQQLITHLSYI